MSACRFAVVGVDSSLTAFGLAIARFEVATPGVDAPVLTRLDLEVLTSKPDKSMPVGEDTSQRLRGYWNRLAEIVEETWPEDVEALAVEATAFMGGKSSFRTIHATARARQVVDDVGSMAKVKVFEVSSSDVGKKAVDRPTGKSPKSERIDSLSERYSLFASALSSVKPSLAEHAADAFAVVLCAMPRIMRERE